MMKNTTVRRGIRVAAAWSLLAAILACGGSDDSNNTTNTGSNQGTTGTTGTTPPPMPPPTVPPPTTPTPPPMPPPTAAGSFTLTPGFMPDPRTATGTAGGTFAASTRSPTCRGYIGATASHTLNLAQPFANLRVLVNAPGGDTTLMIQLANGQFLCADDSEGVNPIVQGPFPAGIHQVYVGSYAPGQNIAYTLGVTENSSIMAASLGGAPGAAVPAGPSQAMSLTTGFIPDPQTGRGTAGGTVDAAGMTSGACRGWIPAMPQHVVTLQSGFASLRVLVNSQADTSLVIRAPDGTYRCADDSEGLQPIVPDPRNGIGSTGGSGPWTPGVYQVFVGTYQAAATGTPYVIGFTELSSVTNASLGM